MKKLTTLILSLLLIIPFAGCDKQESSQNSGNQGQGGEIAVFYYTFSDTYISSVRAEMDKELNDAGLKYQNYDGRNEESP